MIKPLRPGHTHQDVANEPGQELQTQPLSTFLQLWRRITPDKQGAHGYAKGVHQGVFQEQEEYQLYHRAAGSAIDPAAHGAQFPQGFRPMKDDRKVVENAIRSHDHSETLEDGVSVRSSVAVGWRCDWWGVKIISDKIYPNISANWITDQRIEVAAIFTFAAGSELTLGKQENGFSVRKERRQGRLCRLTFVGSLRLWTSTVTNMQNQRSEKFCSKTDAPRSQQVRLIRPWRNTARLQHYFPTGWSKIMCHGALFFNGSMGKHALGRGWSIISYY